MTQPVAPKPSTWTTPLRPLHTMLIILAVFLPCLAWFLGSFHIVQSSDQGTRLVRKVHFTFAETVVSLDAITGQPAVAAKAKYPLTIKALQRDALLESDAEREERIEREVEAHIEGSRREAEALIRDAAGR